MSESECSRVNCWDFLGCDRGPDAHQPCAVATDSASDGVNGGHNGGRLCWAIAGTLSGNEPLAACALEKDCRECDFLHLVRSEEGDSFKLLKLARGVCDLRELQQTIVQVESLEAIHERLRSRFDLDATVGDITREARKVTGAQRSVVLIIRGNPPALHGEFMLRGKRNKVVINVDEKSAVGFAAFHNQMVNLRNIYDADAPGGGLMFDKAFDNEWHCRTQSFLAVPVRDSEGRVIGVITGANAKKGFFSSDDEWFMRNYATEVALAVEKQKFIQQSVSALRLAAIGETVAGLSHCIKNIAQALRSGSHIIKRAIKTNSVQDIKAAWDILDRHIERLADLSMDVLTYDPTVRGHSKGGGLNELVAHVVELFEEEARARAAEIVARQGENVDPATFNPLGIYRCLVNLIGNALDACPLSDGLVTVATERTGEKEFMISVTDNGRGMDDETKASVFEIFKTSKSHSGAGLGLPTVADIVSKHNGRLEIDSEPGKGTTFRILIREDIVTA